jgi:hypothetical protein
MRVDNDTFYSAGELFFCQDGVRKGLGKRSGGLKIDSGIPKNFEKQ